MLTLEAPIFASVEAVRENPLPVPPTLIAEPVLLGLRITLPLPALREPLMATPAAVILMELLLDATEAPEATEIAPEPAVVSVTPCCPDTEPLTSTLPLEDPVVDRLTEDPLTEAALAIVKSPAAESIMVP